MLQQQSPDEAVVARFGGEEFISVLPGPDQELALVAAERYHAATDTTPLGGLRITICIGAATFAAADTELSLLQQADQALYLSKNNDHASSLPTDTHNFQLRPNITMLHKLNLPYQLMLYIKKFTGKIVKTA